MTTSPAQWSVGDLASLDPASTALLTTPSARARASALARFPLFTDESELSQYPATLLALGGGTLIDRAKYLRAKVRPGARLIAIPTIWGSGAERSPIVVLDRNGTKEIHTGNEFLPDAFVYSANFSASLPAWLAKYACADTWAHTLEAFLSPLAAPDARKAAGSLLRRLISLPPGAHTEWFSASGEACTLQAESSVGLIHGIAHTLEAPLRAEFPQEFWGHSKLCSTFLYPVFRFNRQFSTRPDQFMRDNNIEPDAIEGVLRESFEPLTYRQALPALRRHWQAVLRNACTRTNAALVRPVHLAFFEEFI